MVINSIFAYLHFLAAFGIVSTVFYVWLTFNRNLTYIEARNIQRCDRWYGIFAAVILVVGFLRVYRFEKGSDFYLSNPFFFVKVGLFIVIGLLSIYPTVKFLAWRKHTQQNMPPSISDKEFSSISLVLNLELSLLLVLILAASLMAKGISR